MFSQVENVPVVVIVVLGVPEGEIKFCEIIEKWF